MSRDPLVVVRRFDSMIELDWAKTSLESAGLHAVTMDDNTLNADPVISVAIGGARLLVPESQVEDAREILYDLFGEPDTKAVQEIAGRMDRRMLWMLPVWIVAAFVTGAVTKSPETGGVVLIGGVVASFVLALYWEETEGGSANESTETSETEKTEP